MVSLPKPSQLHDRDQEWQALTRFVGDDQLGARLGLVYGRRRQGKTLMLDLAVQAGQGFIFTGLPQSSSQNLERLSQSYNQFVDGPAVTFPDWDAALDALLRLGERDEPLPVVIDEFQYLVEAEPALPSILQIALGPTSRAATRSRARLVLCGSAIGAMRGLLGGSAPLRGRAALEMMVHPFRFRDAASFWSVADQPDLAFRLNALIGGTPAYRPMSQDVPTSADDFDDWVVRGPLDPASGLFREGNVLLGEQPELVNTNLYYSVLSAIARGATRRNEIAAALGRSEQSLAHPLAVLESTQLICRVEDAIRQRRPTFKIAEPIIRTGQLIISPREADLVGGAGRQVWRESADTVTANIYGPHFEDLARQWSLWYADRDTLGGHASSARSTVLSCPEHRSSHELDVVVHEKRPGGKDVVIAIGEVKYRTDPVGIEQVDRLSHIRDLLPAGHVEEEPRLLVFSRSGFTAGLRERAREQPGIQLVDLDRLYNGA